MPWKDVAVDFQGPIHTGVYLLVMVCKQSRWAEVEFTTPTSATVVIRKMDNTFASLGIPVSVSSDNGPLFNGIDFSDFSKHLGFHHERKTLLNLQANADVEQFINLLKLLHKGSSYSVIVRVRAVPKRTAAGDRHPDNPSGSHLRVK